MTIYSIEKVGSEYVVKADDQSLLRVGSRRRAAQLVIEASGLLEEARALAAPLMAADVTPVTAAPGIAGPDAVASIARERGEGA